MSKASDRDVETLLRSAAFPNPAHKEALRQRLFGDGAELELDDLALAAAELELDDLALAAGGLAEPFVPPEAWPDKEMRHA